MVVFILFSVIPIIPQYNPYITPMERWDVEK